MKNPPNWYDVLPSGTKEGDEELKFFIALARTKYQWRSVSALARESGLTRENVEKIIEKYYKKGMVFQNPKNEDQWGYWQRNPEMLPKSQKTISQKDQDDRISKLNKSCTEFIFGGNDDDSSSYDCSFKSDGKNFNMNVKRCEINALTKPLKFPKFADTRIMTANDFFAKK